MSPVVRVWPTPEAFLANLGAIDEVAGCVVHGLVHTWLARPASFRPGTPLLTAEFDGDVAAAGILAGVGKLVCSLGPVDAILMLDSWCEENGRRPTVIAAPEAAAPALLARRPGHRGLETTLYRLDAPPTVPTVPGRLRIATLTDADLLTDWIADFNVEARLPPDPKPRALVEAKLAAGHLFVWETDDEPKAIAAMAGPTPRATRMNTVYTPPALRSRGYASAAVASLAARQFDLGRRVVTLFADRGLAHTNRMYRKIGFRPVADFTDVEIDRA